MATRLLQQAPLEPESPPVEPESQPVPDPTADHEALAEHNHELKRKLRHAVMVTNGCARALEKEKAEAGEKIRKLDLALLLERSAHQRRRDNPTGARLGPTPAEVYMSCN